MASVYNRGLWQFTITVYGTLQISALLCRHCEMVKDTCVFSVLCGALTDQR